MSSKRGRKPKLRYQAAKQRVLNLIVSIDTDIDRTVDELIDLLRLKLQVYGSDSAELLEHFSNELVSRFEEAFNDEVN